MSDTILIESNREIAYARQTETQDAPSNTWTTTLQNGIELDVGDEVSIDNIQINIRGVPDESIEFLGDNTNANTKGLKDNEGILRIGFYMTNRLQFNMPLPLGHHVSKSYVISVTNETNANNPGMAVDRLSRNVDYGLPALSSFTLFRQAYPYSQIEGFTTTDDPDTDPPVALPNLLSFSNPPNPIDNQAEIRLYLMNDDYKGIHGKISGDSTDETITPPNIRTADVTITIPEGFNTPDNVATNITEQLHNRVGKADGWTSSFVDGNFFKQTGTPNTANSVVSAVQNPVITDSCFRSISTSTGDLYYSPPGFARYGDNVAEGTSYTERAGLNLFYKNLLIGNPFEYIAMVQYLNCRKNLFRDDGLSNAITNDLECLFTGNRLNAQGSGGESISNLGAFPCIMDRLDIKRDGTELTKETPIGMEASTNSAHKTSVNVKPLNMPNNALIPTNIPYTNGNLKNILEMMKVLEQTSDGDISLNTKNDNKSSFFVDMGMGRSDDSFCCSSAKTFCGPPFFAVGINPDDAPFSVGNLNENNFLMFTQDKIDYGLYTPDLTLFNTSTAGAKLNATQLPPRRIGFISDASFDAKDNLSVFRFYDKNFDANAVETPTHNFNTQSFFQLTNPLTSQIQSMQFSIDNDVAIVPVFLKNTDNNTNIFGSDAIGIPFCAFVSVDTQNNGKVPPIFGEYFGPSPSLHDNLISKIVTTQKVQTTKGTYNTGTNPTDYMPYCMIGADDPVFEFDNSRFKISGFHTAVRASNGTFQNPLGKLDSSTTSKEKPSNPQADEISLQQNGNEAMISVYSPSTNIPVAPLNVTQNVRPFPEISSQAGIGLIDILAIKKARSNALTDTILNVDSRLNYKGTLFDKLGFDIEQLHPPVNMSENHQFNRSNYNKFIGRNESLLQKQENMLYPFTTNAYISGSEQIGMVKNVKGSEMVNLGATNTFQGVFTNAESDELVARQLPKKLDFSYLVVYSNIIPNTNYYSAQSVRVPAMAYVTRSFTTGDFFFSSENPTYIVDKPYIITDFETRIVLPNGSDAEIDDNSTIIYKIVKQKTLPAPQVPPRPKQK